MILTDKLGTRIFPGQIHGLAVVDARHTPNQYTRPDCAAFAVVVEGQTLDQHASGGYFMSELRWVLAWFEHESLAQAALEELIAAFIPNHPFTQAEIFEGALS